MSKIKNIILDGNVKIFWKDDRNKILFESKLKLFVSKTSFFVFHKNIEVKDI